MAYSWLQLPTPPDDAISAAVFVEPGILPAIPAQGGGLSTAYVFGGIGIISGGNDIPFWVTNPAGGGGAWQASHVPGSAYPSGARIEGMIGANNLGVFITFPTGFGGLEFAQWSWTSPGSGSRAGYNATALHVTGLTSQYVSPVGAASYLFFKNYPNYIGVPYVTGSYDGSITTNNVSNEILLMMLDLTSLRPAGFIRCTAPFNFGSIPLHTIQSGMGLNPPPAITAGTSGLPVDRLIALTTPIGLAPPTITGPYVNWDVALPDNIFSGASTVTATFYDGTTFTVPMVSLSPASLMPGALSAGQIALYTSIAANPSGNMATYSNGYVYETPDISGTLGIGNLQLYDPGTGTLGDLISLPFTRHNPGDICAAVNLWVGPGLDPSLWPAGRDTIYVVTEEINPDTFDVDAYYFYTLVMTGGTPDSISISELYFTNTDGFFDLSKTTNRRRLIGAMGGAQYLGADGSAVLGATPAVYLTVTGGGLASTADTFANNNGNGGAFTAAGVDLTLADTNPPGVAAVYPAGPNIVGDYRNGNLYAFNLDQPLDDGEQRRWLRTWRALQRASIVERRFDCLTITMETGIQVPDGTDPQATLRWSDDGGHTWSNERIEAAGPTGAVSKQVMFKRLGSTKRFTGMDRVFELSSADPFKVALIAADIDP